MLHPLRLATPAHLVRVTKAPSKPCVLPIRPLGFGHPRFYWVLVFNGFGCQGEQSWHRRWFRPSVGKALRPEDVEGKGEELPQSVGALHFRSKCAWEPRWCNWGRGETGVAWALCAVVRPCLLGAGVCVTELGSEFLACVTTALSVTAESLPSSLTSPAAEKLPSVRYLGTREKICSKKTPSWDKNVGTERASQAGPGQNSIALHPRVPSDPHLLTHFQLQGVQLLVSVSRSSLHTIAMKFPVSQIRDLAFL